MLEGGSRCSIRSFPDSIILSFGASHQLDVFVGQIDLGEVQDFDEAQTLVLTIKSKPYPIFWEIQNDWLLDGFCSQVGEVQSRINLRLSF